VGEEDAHGLRPIRIAPMKRSFIDARIEAMLALCERHGVRLPPFAQWSERDFRADRDAAGFIAACGLGWNVVEFKPGAFATDGLTLFTLRMGDWRQLEARGGRLYARTASAPRTTITRSRPRTSSIAAARASWSSCSRSTAPASPSRNASAR
jgi:hypothetical protein